MWNRGRLPQSVIEKDGAKVKVSVGSVAHPMLEEHSIRFIVIETKQGFAKKDLNPGDEPVAEFADFLNVFNVCRMYAALTLDELEHDRRSCSVYCKLQ